MRKNRQEQAGVLGRARLAGGWAAGDAERERRLARNPWAR
jgi:hypothetical protein